MAIPGESTCHPVGACAAGRFPEGDLFVDGSFTGTSDGTRAAPFSTIGAALSLARSGSTVAIAAGTYAENLLLTKEITLVGVCAAKVELKGVATASATLEITGAVTLRDLAITSAAWGISEESAGTTLERVWVHDTARSAVETYGKVTLRDVLIENVRVEGVYALGAEVLVERTVFRDIAPDVTKVAGQGVHAELDLETKKRARVTVRRSVVERATELGIGSLGSIVRVEGSVVRDTRPRATDGKVGTGIYATRHAPTASAGEMTVIGSFISGNRRANIYGLGATLVVERTVLREGKPRELGGGFGLGLEAAGHSDVNLRDSLVEQNLYVGVGLFGSTGTIERTLIRDTLGRASDGKGGSGLVVWTDSAEQASSDVTARSCRIERSRGAGVYVGGSSATLDNVFVTDTRPQADGAFGDAVAVVPFTTKTVFHDATLSISKSLLERSARSGAFIAGATLHLGDSVLRCHPLDIAIEKAEGRTADGASFPRDPVLDDVGHVTCGCAGAQAKCAGSSSGLAPASAPETE